MYNKFLPKFKVVEINNMAALRMGHVIAQNAIDKENIRLEDKSGYKYLENGVIVGLGIVLVLALGVSIVIPIVIKKKKKIYTK